MDLEFISIGRAYDPLSGSDLEGAGVTPDILITHEKITMNP